MRGSGWLLCSSRRWGHVHSLSSVLSRQRPPNAIGRTRHSLNPNDRSTEVTGLRISRNGSSSWSRQPVYATLIEVVTIHACQFSEGVARFLRSGFWTSLSRDEQISADRQLATTLYSPRCFTNSVGRLSASVSFPHSSIFL